MLRYRTSFAPQFIRRFHSARSRRRELFDSNNAERVTDEVDVCIVGAGPAGLSAAIRLKQLEQEKGREVRVVVLEKGAEVGTSSRLTLSDSKTTPEWAVYQGRIFSPVQSLNPAP
jgi:electron-transferring-flavoprotein dehydrogenase